MRSTLVFAPRQSKTALIQELVGIVQGLRRQNRLKVAKHHCKLQCMNGRATSKVREIRSDAPEEARMVYNLLLDAKGGENE